MELVRGLNVTVLSAIHDLNIAAMYCDRLYILKDGEIVGSGTPEELLTPETIRRVYQVGVGNCPGSKRENVWFVYGRKNFHEKHRILTCLRAGRVCAGVSCLRFCGAPVFFEEYGTDVRADCLYEMQWLPGRRGGGTPSGSGNVGKSRASEPGRN